MSKLRFITATSLFDGHDASINIMRRLLQSKGIEVIHLGHNIEAMNVVLTALSEDAHAVAISSYQGGHNEYFKYIRDLLNEKGGENIRIFGGGGGVITPSEIADLEKYGIDKIYSPQDGMKLGLSGIIADMIKRTSKSPQKKKFKDNESQDFYFMASVISHIEDSGEIPFEIHEKNNIPVLGITGTGGSGKSSLIDELFLRLKLYYPQKRVALVSIDPTRKKTQGALLGDRIRMGNACSENFYVRSLATRDSKSELSPHIKKVVSFLKSKNFDLIMVETSGIGQSANEITTIADKCVYVMTSEYGASFQLEKIDMLGEADYVVINKFDHPRSEDAYRDVCKQYLRERPQMMGEEVPVYGTRASQFNNQGVNQFFYDVVKNFSWDLSTMDNQEIKMGKISTGQKGIIPPSRTLYLREIVDTIKSYNSKVKNNTHLLKNYEALSTALEHCPQNKDLIQALEDLRQKIPPKALAQIEDFDRTVKQIKENNFSYQVRGKDILVDSKFVSQTRLKIPKMATPSFSYMSQKYNFIKGQNLPGFFPYVNGVFPFKRSDEEPKRQFAGEGGPLRTNKRFHYLSKNDPAKRLSTAFDSVTLYGADPHLRPDIYGKIGESGVSIATLNDMKDLLSGFDLTDPKTSVSMTINGPAPIMLAMYLNAAMAQKLNDGELQDPQKRLEIMRKLRGTVQADILKEDQAQNTCIFSLDFALKLQGDVQEFFSKNKIKNYYTISISGYHIAEAGANPITQVALTLANGFTFVEYYLSRGLSIDDICSNISFFFSNGLDAEYAVIGRVARKIWALAMRDIYKASPKSQKLKYHIQTSGRSLHSQEINFNDIRTTLQAFLAISDNCNSLHTNSYDEAITTPTQESVRRAMAIQLIINREFGLSKTDNPLQGSYLVEELSELVEEAICSEFERLSDRGGVLGAMESMYQRNKIQDESLYYETLKDSGELPIIGVNTYLSEDIDEQMQQEIPMSRSTKEEKDDQIKRLNDFKDKNKDKSKQALENLKNVALSEGNIFEELLTTVNHCSLGEIVSTLYAVGGQYRRNV